MIMAKPLLSVVVPTKNRYIYLKELVKLVNSFNDADLELVIQDNSDCNEEILDFLLTIKNENIRYFYSSEKLAATENADKGILNSTGEYVCFIGDDDGVMRWITKVVRYMKNNGIDSLIANKPQYSWPDIKSALIDSSSTLIIQKTSENLKEINCINELRYVERQGFLTMGMLPRVYHGIVSRETMDKLYKQTGTFFPGPCPDMSNAVGLSFLVKKHVYVNYPVVISGAGYNSAAGMGARHQHSGKISEVSFLPKNTEEEWESSLPKYWLGQTIWPNTAIKALRNTNHEDHIANINFSYIYSAMIVFHASMFSITKPFLSIKNIFPVSLFSLCHIFARAVALIRNTFDRMSKNGIFITTLKNISNIKTAEEVIYQRTRKLVNQ